MFKKSNLLKFALFLAILNFSCVNVVLAEECPENNPNCNELGAEADNNNYDGEQPNTHDCPECTYNTWYDTGSTITIQLETGEQISFDVTGPGNQYPCEGCTVVDGFPSALTDSGGTNTDYRPETDEWLEGAIVDGGINPDHPVGAGILEVIVEAGHCAEGDVQCANDFLLNNIDTNGDDGIGIIIEPFLIVKEAGVDNYEKAYGDDAKKYPGITGSNLIENMCAADATGNSVPEFGMSENTFCAGNLDLDGKLCGDGDDDDDDDDDDDYHGDDDDDDDDDPYIPPTCPYPPCETDPQPPKLPDFYEEKEVPSYEMELSPPPVMVCGSPYSATIRKYDGYVPNSCEKEMFINTYDVRIDAVENNKKVAAGNSFFWGDTRGSVNLTRTTTPGTVLDAETYNRFAAAENLRLLYQYVKDYLDYYDEKIESFETSASYYVYDCLYTSCNQEDDEVRQRCKNNVSSACNSMNYYNEKATEYRNEKQEFYTETYIPAEETYNRDYPKAKAEYDKFQACLDSYTAQYLGYRTFSNLGNNVSTSNEKMTLLGITQEKGSMGGYNKHNGNLVFKSDLESSSIKNQALLVASPANSFVVPMNVANGTKGKLTETVSVSEPSLSFNLVCNMQVNNSPYVCPDPPCEDPTVLSLDVIFRPISLNNPFPKTGSTGSRMRTGKWSYDSVVQRIITNNRSVATNSVYNLTPMYTITLTPAVIQDIRDYNKKHNYGDFNLRCTNGLYCQSNFLWGYDSSLDNFSNIVDMSNSCAMSSNWYNCNPELQNYMEGFYSYLK